MIYKDRFGLKSLAQPRLVAEFMNGVIYPGTALTLALLVLGVLADNHNAALALDDLALLAHGLHGRSNFHCNYLQNALWPRTV